MWVVLCILADCIRNVNEAREILSDEHFFRGYIALFKNEFQFGQFETVTQNRDAVEGFATLSRILPTPSCVDEAI